MERLNINEEMAFQYVIGALRDLGYFGELKIEKFINDDNYDYIVTEKLNYKGKMTTRIIPMKKYFFNQLIEYGLFLKGAENINVGSYLSKGKIIYFAKYQAFSHGNGFEKYTKKKRR